MPFPVGPHILPGPAGDADRTAESTRATQVAAILTKLDAGTATMAEVQTTLARIIRYIKANTT